MINLSTPNSQLITEVYNDYNRAIYWLKKQMGGDKKYEQKRYQMLIQAKKEARTIISDVVEYKSPTGNRWLCFECARYFPDANSSYTEPYAFCYYETLGSVGAFVPVKTEYIYKNMESDKTVVIFTSHFFYQMSKRMDLTYRSREMVRRFLEYIPSLVFSFREDNGRTGLDVRLPGSIGRGFLRDEKDSAVFEVRTFLRDIELTNYQKKVTKKLRQNADKFKYEPNEVKMNRIMHSDKPDEAFKELYYKDKEKYVLSGGDAQYFDERFNTITGLGYIFTKMDLVKEADTEIWERTAIPVSKLIDEYVKSDDKDFVKLSGKIAKVMNLTKFTEERCQEELNELWRLCK